jgi:hypothetical protein
MIYRVCSTNPKEGDEMLKRLSIILSVLAVLGLGLALATSDAVFAQNKQHHSSNTTKHYNKNYKSSKKNYTHHNTTHKYVVGRTYGHHVYYGRHRHYWHGRWYEYGVGPCWINVGGVWFWNLLACP